MNNNIKISTTDGKKIKVEFNNEQYEYSIESLSIDVSNLIEALAESNIIEEINIDDQEFIDYSMEKETSDEFNELYNFILSIPMAYNKSVKKMQELD